MAAAHVSGVVALLLDAKPDLPLKAIRELLYKTAKHLNSGDQVQASDSNRASVAGIVDAYESLEAITAPIAIKVAPAGAMSR